MDHSTVARRLTALEQELGARLFERTSRGLKPTDAGFALLPHAERIESELLAASASVASRDQEIEGTVRLATTEMFGTFLVAPHVEGLRQRHPGLMLELVAESRVSSLARREADIAVMLTMPPKGRLVARKLTDYRLGLFASRDYLDRYGVPRNLDALRDHRFVSYIEELAGFPEIIALDQALPGVDTAFRSTSAAAQHVAVGGGIGLGMLHLFAAARDPHLIRILPDEVEVVRTYWLVMHADLQRLPRVRATVEFLERIVCEMKSDL